MNKLFATLAVAAALTAVPAAAQPAETVSATVKTADLDLASSAGRATLQGRVKVLANQLCGAVSAASIREARPVANCRAELFHSADRQVSVILIPAETGIAGTR